MEITIENIVYNLKNLLNSNPLNLSSLSWIEPVGLCVINALKRYKTDLTIIMPENPNIRNYFDIMTQGECADNIFCGNTYVPLCSLPARSRDKVDRISREIVERILKDPGFAALDTDYAKDCRIYLSYMLTEVLNNAVDHANSKIDVIVCAQHFPKKKRTQVAIVDCGVGFKATLSGRYNIHDEADALEKAIQREVTGAVLGMYQTTTRNIGMGLYVLTEMIKHLNGQILMISNNGMLWLKNRAISTKLLDAPWHGSIIVFEVDTTKINFDFSDFMRIYIYQQESEAEDIF